MIPVAPVRSPATTMISPRENASLTAVVVLTPAGVSHF